MVYYRLLANHFCLLAVGTSVSLGDFLKCEKNVHTKHERWGSFCRVGALHYLWFWRNTGMVDIYTTVEFPESSTNMAVGGLP